MWCSAKQYHEEIIAKGHLNKDAVVNESIRKVHAPVASNGVITECCSIVYICAHMRCANLSKSARKVRL